MRVAPAGDRAVLVELGEVSAAELHAYARKVRDAGFAAIAGHSSILIVEDRQSGLSGLHGQAGLPVLHRIPVVFDGPEADLLPRGFEQRIPPLTARYLGFRGGFAYLDGWPEEWALPRRETSRPVRRGTFAVAGNVAGFYPIDSPGGWNLLGRTNVELENAIAPGDTLILEPAEHLDFVDAPRKTAPLASAEIVSAPLAVRTDDPFDDVAGAIASRAAGGATELLECALAGPRLRFTRDCVIAWVTPDLDVRVERVRKGEERAFGRISGGLRAYLAIGEREGVVAKLERGDRRELHAYRGPHEASIGDFECEVTPRLDRVGIRMRPLHPLALDARADLRSIGMLCGTTQIHPDGSVIVMGPDHPVTGGYLQPVTVLSTERWKLAQLLPGERVLFRVTNRTDIPSVP